MTETVDKNIHHLADDPYLMVSIPTIPFGYHNVKIQLLPN